MKKILRNKKGFTFTEVMFVGIISVIVIGGILSAWIFTYRTWTVERQYTELRIDLMNALEIIKNDLRLSSLTYMSFYPNTEQTYTAVSMPVAETDSNGFFTLDTDEKIDWDRTVIYYLHTAGDGSKTLRRKVFDPRDNTKDEDERYTQLEDVVTGEEGEEFLKRVGEIEEAGAIGRCVEEGADGGVFEFEQAAGLIVDGDVEAVEVFGDGGGVQGGGGEQEEKQGEDRHRGAEGGFGRHEIDSYIVRFSFRWVARGVWTGGDT